MADQRKALSNEQLTDLWHQWKEEQDMEAKKSLIENYLPIVHFVSSRLSIGLPKNVAHDDLISYGIMGLIDAVEKFDLSRGLQFDTYASWRIRGAIIDGLRQADWVPRSVREKAKKIEEAYQNLEQKYLRSVSDEEMSHYLEISMEDFHKTLQEIAVTTIFSLEDPIKEEETETRMSLLIDEKAINPGQTVNQQFIRESLEKAIDRLTVKERTVVSLYYFEDLSLSEIAEVMSLTPSRISQLHSKAIMRLRGSLARNKDQLFQDR